MDASELLQPHRVVPVVVLEDPETSVPLAQALVAGGIRVIEVTLRTTAALDAIELIAQSVPEILLGAGSVRRPEQVEQVLKCGARFIVSPGSTPLLLDAARSNRAPFVPGATTATEVLSLLELDYSLLKFFPILLAVIEYMGFIVPCGNTGILYG